MRTVVWVLLLVGGLFTFIACAGSEPATEPDTTNIFVPAAYRSIYHELDHKLDEINRSLQARWDGRKSDTAFGVELLVANSNRGEVLLQERVFQATVMTLERLKQLGVRSLSLSIQYPTLAATHPRYAEYRAFYRRVAAEIKKRGFKLVVEMGSIFKEPEFSSMPVDYSGLTRARFNRELLDMAQVIVNDMQPDYLTILTEPATMARNTGLSFSVSEFAESVRYVAAGLEYADVNIGAGAGSWDSPAYFTALAKISRLDYLDVHIYPIQGDLVLGRALSVARLARAHGKRVSIGEAWLYKVSRSELRRIRAVDAYARDVFSFWRPLDQKFIDMTVALSHAIDAEFCSFFWMKYLYAYIDYNDETKGLSPGQLMRRSETAAGQKILEGQPNQTGKRLEALISK